MGGVLFLAFHVFSAGIHKGVEEEMATHSSILAYRNHGQRSLAGYSPWGRKESDTAERPSTSGGDLECASGCKASSRSSGCYCDRASLPEDEECLISEHRVQVTAPGHVLPGCAIFDFSLSSGGKGVWPLPLGVCGLYGQLGLCACLPSSL